MPDRRKQSLSLGTGRGGFKFAILPLNQIDMQQSAGETETF